MSNKAIYLISIFSLSISLAASKRHYTPPPSEEVSNILFEEVTRMLEDPETHTVPGHQVSGNLTYEYKKGRRNDFIMIYENEAAENDASPHITVFPNISSNVKSRPHLTINAQDRSNGYRTYFEPSCGIQADDFVTSSYGNPDSEYYHSYDEVEEIANNILDQVRTDWEYSNASIDEGYCVDYIG